MPKAIKTTVDKLVDFIYKRKKTTIPEIASALGLTENQVTEWLDALEEHGVISLEYTALKGAFVKSKPLSDEELAERMRELDKIKASLSKTAATVTSSITGYEKQIPLLEKHLSLIDSEIKQTLRAASEAASMLGDITRIKEKFELELKGIEKEEAGAAETKKQLDALDKKINKVLAASQLALSQISEKLKKSSESMRPFFSDLETVKKQRRDLDKRLGNFKHALVLLEKRVKKSEIKPADLRKFFDFVSETEAKAVELGAKESGFEKKIKELDSKLKSLVKFVGGKK